ncbi:inactive protein RESTRICTED TEV MOVEMENT 2 [Vigna radiata var. radiata]|uniref:Inactive protein RESTRICTED TEV MOVEMENT 2 n=1 Tax=Vigna radiata var. radiata TaxID=3916 RepID=A0A1S3TBS1_VIGRR|nr:inactive protein RESTRICTED TEV MOVEMENT 2 [Vigna radiata var. radiata]
MEIPKHAHANRSYEDFDPLFMWRREEGRDTLELHLPGFKRDQIRIQINHVGLLVISGERPSEGNRWRRFKKEFEIPSYCNDDAIHGNMMQSILSVVMPKKSSQILQEEQEMKEEKRGNKRKGESEISEENDMKDDAEYHFEEDDEKVPQETTRDVALKFMLVMVLILVAASYISDVSKSLMAQAASYFHN